jgi:hypothetical protein
MMRRTPGRTLPGMRRPLVVSRAAVVLAAAVLALASGCARNVEPASPTIETADDLLTALRRAGAQVDETAMMATSANLTGGRVILVGPERVEVYEQATQARQQAALADLLQRLPPGSAPKVWGKGRIIVLYGGADGGTIALLSGLLGDTANLPAPAPDEPYPPAVTSAIGWLADESGVDPGQVVVESFETVDWPDACLGLAGPDETCAQVVTPGWRVTLLIGADVFVLHTDELGSTIRQEP